MYLSDMNANFLGKKPLFSEYHKSFWEKLFEKNIDAFEVASRATWGIYVAEVGSVDLSMLKKMLGVK